MTDKTANSNQFNRSVDESDVADRLARRPWPATPLRPGLEVSFEFFPTNSDAGAATLSDSVTKLAALNPTFFSVTYGAGGSTQDRTHEAIAVVRSSSDVEVAGHITSVGSSRADVDLVLDRYRATGVTRLVALRGDAPKDSVAATSPSGYRDAADLVAGIRSRDDGVDFDISVAAYPEVHPMASSANADLDNLKRKIDAGADRAITQFFFDTDAFLRFHEQARAAGITVPIVPGIMPITNFDRICGFAERCGTKVPQWMTTLFDGLDDVPEIRDHIAATVAAEQCRRLAEHGIRQFHFYTMNKAELSLAVCRILGITATPAASISRAVS